MCFHIAVCLLLSFIAKLWYYCLVWLFSILAAIWDSTGLDWLRIWFILNYYWMQRKDRLGGGEPTRAPTAVILPSAVPVSSRSSENSPKLQEVLHQPCPALGQLPIDHHGWWCGPQGGNGAEHKHGSMLTVRMFVQEVDAWIPVVSVLFVRRSEEHTCGGLRTTWDLLEEWRHRVKCHKAGMWIGPSRMLTGRKL